MADETELAHHPLTDIRASPSARKFASEKWRHLASVRALDGNNLNDLETKLSRVVDEQLDSFGIMNRGKAFTGATLNPEP